MCGFDRSSYGKALWMFINALSHIHKRLFQSFNVTYSPTLFSNLPPALDLITLASFTVWTSSLEKQTKINHNLNSFQLHGEQIEVQKASRNLYRVEDETGFRYYSNYNPFFGYLTIVWSPRFAPDHVNSQHSELATVQKMASFCPAPTQRSIVLHRARLE